MAVILPANSLDYRSPMCLLMADLGTLKICPSQLWKRTWGASAVWVRGFRNVRRLQKQAFQ